LLVRAGDIALIVDNYRVVVASIGKFYEEKWKNQE